MDALLTPFKTSAIWLASGTEAAAALIISLAVIEGLLQAMQKFKSQGSVQRFLFSNSATYNCFDSQPHLIFRPGNRILRAQAHAARRRRSSLPDGQGAYRRPPLRLA